MHKKITVGFVIQNYDGDKCVSQEFVAGDQVDYEDESGETIDIDTTNEQYQPFDMVQPESEKPKYGWGWIDGEDDNEGDKWIQISELDYTDPDHPCLDEEMATIMFRNYEEYNLRFPNLKKQKESYAQQIVDALNQ
jgi:hypothetical protein